MKKIIFLLVFYYSLLITHYSFSQSGWYWQNPLPQGNDINSVSFVNSMTGFAGCDNGLFMKTSNGGNDWVVINTEFIINIRKVCFLNSNTGFLLLNNLNTLYKTTNTGQTWDTVNFGPVFGINNIKFVYEQKGFIVGYNSKVLKTTNSGLNWQDICDTNYKICFYNIEIINDSTYICVGGKYTNVSPYAWTYKGYAARTSNYGITWNGTNFTNYILCDIKFVNNSIGYISGTENLIVKSYDGGITWGIVHSGTGLYYRNLYFFNANTGFSLSNFSIDNKLKTTNGGSTWQTETTNIYNDVTSLGDNKALIAGNYCGLIKTSDNGISWTSCKKSIFNRRFYDVQMINSNLAFIIGDSGIIFKTTNGGINWNRQISNKTNFLTSVCFTDELNGNIVGYGTILNTTNGGVNWVNRTFDTTLYLEKVCFVNPNTGFVTARDSKIFKSTNGGINWNRIYLDSSLWRYTGIFFLNQNTGFITGDNGSLESKSTVFKTTNCGLNWNSYFGPQSPMEIYFINAQTGFTCGESGEIFRSTNGGLNWSDCSFSTYSVLVSTTFINETTGYISADHSGLLLKTTNSGANWNQVFAGIPYEWGIWGISSYGNDIIYVGDFGMIKSTKPGGGIIIKKITDYIPDHFSLSQNYPNPFNPTTNIKFKIPKLSSPHALSGDPVKLIVYNILGKEIATLVNEKLKPGEYEVTFNGSNLSSGIYFYTLSTDGFKETKKMLLIK